MSVAIGLAPRSVPARLPVRLDLHWRMRAWNQAMSYSQRLPIRTYTSSKVTEPVASQLYACTWLTTTPDQLTPEDIFSNLPLTAPNLPSQYVPILLFTPGLASWANAKGIFLEQWMNRFYQNTSDSPSHIHAITAVIDRLPYKHVQGSSRDMPEAEGVSVLLARGENILSKAVSPRQVRSVETEEPALLFSFCKDTQDAQVAHHPVHEIGLRLANTIFLNGKENTLVGARWSYDPSLERVRLESALDLSRCSVTVTPTRLDSALELPLYPVGERRKVISSMGNILRQISKHIEGTSTEPMPASSELEKELPRYIEEHDISDRRVSVWALIETSAESPYIRSRHSSSGLAQAIVNGAKLHRVMSGGGGWGKKQGLLSLDPEMSFGQPSNESLQSLDNILSNTAADSVNGLDFSLELPTSLQDLSTLSQAAEPGNYVQFFVSVEASQPHSDSSPTTSSNCLSVDFGVVSNADSLLSHRAPQKDLVTVPNYFGALSEKAVSFLQPVSEPEPNMFGSCTKIDVPGSRIRLELQ
ncbi:hypothetical protein BJY04DRAFT_92488 [Aspergillus karnatakaensis]|uniref:uncharacterized protein n=1 Tax=Aspergillus karnatakaensis TaxID=1810916 RepID=UPI003CCD26AB